MPTLSLNPSPLRAQVQAAHDPVGASMPSKSSKWVSLGARIFQLALQDLLGKALPLPSPQQMGWQSGAWGRVRGSFLSREWRNDIWASGQEDKEEKKGVGSLPTQSHQPLSVLQSLSLKAGGGRQ